MTDHLAFHFDLYAQRGAVCAICARMNIRPHDCTPETLTFSSSNTIPNHPSWPLLIYRKVFDASVSDIGSAFESLFARNHWSAPWRGDVYTYHHYHSTTHEALGVYRGAAKLRLGGPNGETVEVSEGDVVIIPAGVGHQRLEARGTFSVVGAYPVGCSYDELTEDASPMRAIKARIKSLPAPKWDPIYGETGPLCTLWPAPK